MEHLLLFEQFILEEKKPKGGLDKWFKEKWVDVCRPKGKSYEKCGRKKSSWKKYPYCRPLYRINKNTPRTVGELSKKRIKGLCKSKRKNPRKKAKVLFKFGKRSKFSFTK